MKKYCKKISIFIIMTVFSLFVIPREIDASNGNIDVSGKVKNVVLMIGDGMGVGQLEIARLLEYEKDGSLFMESLPNVALMKTSSNSHFVTDSAAGGTAIATGKKTNNGMIGMTPKNKKANSVLHAFQQANKKVGVITTSKVTDATPASFVGHVVDRWGGQAQIARQMLEHKIDVVLGGGSSMFSPKEQQGVSLIKAFINEGYTFVNDKQSLKKAHQANRLLGLFHPSYMNYKLDYNVIETNEPSLIEMTEVALKVLSHEDAGFFLMIEGGRIDHAAHAADATSVWKETIEFDETVKKVVHWAKERQDTLVVVLADHETMGMSVSEPLHIHGLKKVKASPAFMASKLKQQSKGTSFSSSKMKGIFKEYANIMLTDQDVERLKKRIHQTEKGIYPEQIIAWEIGNMLAEHFQVSTMSRDIRTKSRTTSGHSGNMVPVFAYGPSAELFEGVLQNTDIAKMIATIAGISFSP